ncbi:MAG: hypothetical protein K2Q01_12610, partial [Rickettsiales bacterium]|nr:hypothetical protein [Rickettsiales bacterium]
MGLFVYKSSSFNRDAQSRMADYAGLLNEIIDRNLFERYGDVQAFGQNRAAYNPAHWGNPSEENPLVSAINSYISNYGIYRISMMLSPEGRVLAVNSRDAKGKPIDTAWLYGATFARMGWFKHPKDGKFLEGRNGLTGTFVTGPIRDEAVAKIYGDDGLVIAFSAPVKNDSGQLVGVWVNLADFGLVEQIVSTFYERLKSNGFEQAEVTLLDGKGAVLVDYDPFVNGEYKRNYDVIGKQNLVDEGVEAALESQKTRGNGAVFSHNAKKMIEQVAGYSYSTGAYDYPGLGWTVLVRASKDVVFASVNSSIQGMIMNSGVLFVVMLLVSLVLGAYIVKALAQYVGTVESIAKGDTDMEIRGQDKKDEIGRLMRATEELRRNVEEAFRLKQMVEDMPANIITMD